MMLMMMMMRTMMIMTMMTMKRETKTEEKANKKRIRKAFPIEIRSTLRKLFSFQDNVHNVPAT